MAKRVYYSVPMIAQAHAKCCWLACYQMLYGWAGRPTSDPVRRAQNVGLNIYRALYEDQWAKARNAMGLTSYRVSYLTDSFDNLSYILSKYGPMWCAGNFLQNSPHAIVISGYDPNNQQLRINDPYEIYKFMSYNYYTYNQWRQLVRNASFACQVWM